MTLSRFRNFDHLSVWSKALLKLLDENFKNLNLEPKINDDGSCSIYFGANQRLIWVSTYSDEFTIGEDDLEGECIYHFHLGSIYGYELSEQTDNLVGEINRLINEPPPLDIAITPNINIDKNTTTHDELRIANEIENTRKIIHHFELTKNEAAAEKYTAKESHLMEKLKLLKNSKRAL